MSHCGDYYVMAHLMVYKSSKLLCRDKQTHTDNKILYNWITTNVFADKIPVNREYESECKV